MDFLTIFFLAILSQQSALGHCFDLAEFFDGQIAQQNYLNSQIHEYPEIIDLDGGYLPEDNFDTGAIGGQTTDQSLTRTDRNLMPEYRNLCEVKTRKVQLSDSEYEFQPPHYHEVYCKSYSLFDLTLKNPTKPAKQMCAHPSFQCVQRSRSLFIVRRRWSSDCWEPFTKEIASGCDCMWPVSTLGDISAHY